MKLPIVFLFTTFLTCHFMMENCNADVADGYLVRWVEQQARKLNFRLSDRPFESVGWADTLEQAIQISHKHKRPIFLFTLDGHMNTGRC